MYLEPEAPDVVLGFEHDLTRVMSRFPRLKTHGNIHTCLLTTRLTWERKQKK